MDTPPASTTDTYLKLTEADMKAALVEARGDIFIASQLLHITAVRLNRAVQVSPMLQATLDAVQEIGKGVSDGAIHEAIEKRLSLYRVAGLDALHELATMPIDENSAQNQVKLSAAARLAGDPAHSMGAGELGETLRELNQQYQANAPRLRVTRERLTVETVPAERAVSQPTPE